MGRPKGIDLTARGYRNLSAAMDEILNPRDRIARTNTDYGKYASMTPEERRAREASKRRATRARAGARQISFTMSIEAAAAVQYLQTQWGFGSRVEALEVALRFMAIETRKGLSKIQLDASADTT